MFDIHNHLLPGVDDGVKNFDESIKFLETFKKNGITTVFFTPHLNHPSVKTNVAKIKENYEKIKIHCEEFGIKSFLGSEIYLTPDVKEFIPIKDYFLLVELPTDIYPVYLLDKLFDLQLEGYEIILAHVERYKWLEGNGLLVDRLKHMNVYFQVNLEALNGSNYFLKRDLVDFIATDFHGEKRSSIDFSLFRKYNDIIEKGKSILKL
ncbi:hypothetical protein JYK00_02690 [Thermosipho ferrireducens]|uniref:protein-tyrosine-phosphatase n=1 Tax=Thermosipho ferrireducens TaxID=2571116 RepID=A0ABX7S790_9BACT|nr:CpsB/CapC family capsule biosynthesis tyrosine phosphatase [Thermosipho ferrireducens]QTA38449.1 hypothetical protein JYK00_02690 [Thermosipho ferrireducens]